MPEPSPKIGPPRSFLLTGGTGFLGTHIASWLREQGHRVIVTGRRGQTRDGHPAISLSLDDVDRICSLVRSEKIDTVVQMACQLLPASNEREFEREISEIHLPMFRLAREIASNGVGFTFISSGGTVYGPTLHDRSSEDDPCQPISLYGQSKLQAEVHLRFLVRTCGLRLLIMRPSNPYGLYQTLNGKQGLISVVLGKVAEQRPLEVWGDGKAVRDYIFVEDAVYSMGELMLRDIEGTFNIGSGTGSSLLDIVQCVEKLTGKSVSLQFHPARAADVPRVVLDVSRLAELRLNRSRSLEAGIRRYIEQLGMSLA